MGIVAKLVEAVADVDELTFELRYRYSTGGGINLRFPFPSSASNVELAVRVPFRENASPFMMRALLFTLLADIEVVAVCVVDAVNRFLPENVYA